MQLDERIAAIKDRYKLCMRHLEDLGDSDEDADAEDAERQVHQCCLSIALPILQ